MTKMPYGDTRLAKKIQAAADILKNVGSFLHNFNKLFQIIQNNWKIKCGVDMNYSCLIKFMPVA